MPKAPFLVAAAFLALTTACRDEPTAPSMAETPAAPAGATAPLVFRQVSAGANHTCGVTVDDLAYCWGENSLGELGLGSATPNKLRPVRVRGGLKFNNVTAGAGYTCGITTDRLAYCWGVNGSGELGDGTTTLRFAPVPVAGTRKWRALSAGYRHTCGVTMADVALCWGYNGDGAVGDGTTANRSKPVKVAGGRVYVQVRAGGNHTCAWTSGGSIYCWGANDEGQLGIGNQTRQLSPVLVPTPGRTFVQVSAGGAHTCAATADHVPYCWGRNSTGAVGDNGTTRWLSPTGVNADGREMAAMVPGNFHSCAIGTDDKAYCWGANDEGQLGDGTNTQRLTPVAVTGGLRFDRISVGAVGFHGCGVTPAGAAYCWGRNNSGQLGVGTMTDRNAPVRVKNPA